MGFVDEIDDGLRGGMADRRNQQLHAGAVMDGDVE